MYNDGFKLFILLLLYVMQGLPMGLASAIPILLQREGLGFGAKGTFSLASWPYSIKILWAPVVDAIWMKSMGRRKSWILPAQMLTGVVMVYAGLGIDAQLGTDTEGINVPWLTSVFFVLYLLAATQDIAVDGWALTLLSPATRSLAASCNVVGQTIGVILTQTLLLAVTDPATCAQWFPETSLRP